MSNVVAELEKKIGDRELLRVGEMIGIFSQAEDKSTELMIIESLERYWEIIKGFRRQENLVKTEKPRVFYLHRYTKKSEVLMMTSTVIDGELYFLVENYFGSDNIPLLRIVRVDKSRDEDCDSVMVWHYNVGTGSFDKLFKGKSFVPNSSIYSSHKEFAKGNLSSSLLDPFLSVGACAVCGESI